MGRLAGEPLDLVMARIEAQQHRRFVKTHTPLDGVPLDPRATYIVVGRHPLDTAVSRGHDANRRDPASADRSQLCVRDGLCRQEQGGAESDEPDDGEGDHRGGVGTFADTGDEDGPGDGGAER